MNEIRRMLVYTNNYFRLCDRFNSFLFRDNSIETHDKIDIIKCDLNGIERKRRTHLTSLKYDWKKISKHERIDNEEGKKITHTRIRIEWENKEKGQTDRATVGGGRET